MLTKEQGQKAVRELRLLNIAKLAAKAGKVAA
jgi:hypothetical protein